MDRGEPPGFSIHVDECVSLDAIAPLPVNREGGLVVFDVGDKGRADGRPKTSVAHSPAKIMREQMNATRLLPFLLPSETIHLFIIFSAKRSALRF